MNQASTLILGAGFGGISAAVQLASRAGDPGSIVLVDRQSHFIAGLRKVWHVTDVAPAEDGQRPLDLLASRHGVTIRQGTVERLDPQSKTAIIDGEPVVAESIVVALGAVPAPTQVPGLSEHGINVWDLAEIGRARKAIGKIKSGRVLIAIAGSPYPCPPAPYELGLLMKEALHPQVEIHIMTAAPMSLPTLGLEISALLDKLLATAGIKLHTNRVLSHVTSQEVVSVDGKRESFDALLAVPPHVCPPMLAEAQLTGPSGWVVVDKHTLQTAYSGVYAIGDCTGIPIGAGRSLPKAGVFAAAQGRVVAERIAGLETSFDGTGSCILDVGGQQAAQVSGQFFSDPASTHFAPPSRDTWHAKRDLEKSLLREWFGA